MAIMRRWDPWRDLIVMQNELNKLFERSLDTEEREARLTAWSPAIDMFEQDGAVVVRAELPGVKTDDIDISVVDKNLVIKGERRLKEEVKEENYYRIEQRYGSFERVVQIPVKINADRVDATFNNGVLEVTLPKAEEITPKQITIKTEQEK